MAKFFQFRSCNGLPLCTTDNENVHRTEIPKTGQKRVEKVPKFQTTISNQKRVKKIFFHSGKLQT